MKNIFLLFSLLLIAGGVFAQHQSVMPSPASTYEGTQITPKGAWCWFADARAQHHSNESGTINSTYIGYIDVHGNIKATQHDFITGRTSEVLIRSYFQPDDHNNPTFLILPDDRVMIFYTRHTDEACFYYRVSKVPGDITTLGAEIRLETSRNTTYPSPFILSDDPTGIYLCWRGINWHPTIARLTLPDENDQVQFTWGPHQIVQSTAARPYAKYASNGKDKIHMTYTTGHPDNENPNYVYFNTIDVNTKRLQDIKGKTLSTIGGTIHQVSATSSYFNANQDAVVENSSFRNWVWQTAMDKDGNPVIAIVRISADKLSHHYYYARWTGSAWQRTFVANGGGKFHQTNNLEMCYSGGMAIDDSDPTLVYCSQPVTGTHGSVYEIVKYKMAANGTVESSEPVTSNSRLNNSRPFVIQDSGDSPLKLTWMNGNYYDWIVSSSRPLGYPTAIHADFQFPDRNVQLQQGLVLNNDFSASANGVLVSQRTSFERFVLAASLQEFSISISPCLFEGDYGGEILKIGDLTYGVDDQSLKPYVIRGDQRWNSYNLLGTSDVWKTQSRGTSGAWYTPTKLQFFNLTLSYADGWLTVYRNGLVDQRLQMNALELSELKLGGFTGWVEDLRIYNRAISQDEVKQLAEISQAYSLNSSLLSEIELAMLEVPDSVVTDVVLLPTTASGATVSWVSSNTSVVGNTGLVNFPQQPTPLTLTATLSGRTRQFNVVVMPRNVGRNRIVDYRFNSEDVYMVDNQRMVKDMSGNGNDARVMGSAAVNGMLDLTANTAGGFSSNGYLIAPEGLLKPIRSMTVLVKMNAPSLNNLPRLFDFGSASSNSVFLRANGFSAGYKYNGATTTLINSSTPIPLRQDVEVAMTYDARTRTTRIFLNGQQTAQSTAITYEPWQLTNIAPDNRNYIGRTQWWSTGSAADNIDYQGTMEYFRVYTVALTAEEIAQEHTMYTALNNTQDDRVRFANPIKRSEALHVSLPLDATNTRVDLLSVNGSLLRSYVAADTTFVLPGIEHRGVYFLRILLPSGSRSYKLMVS
jgi:hypothetical protein